MLRFTEKVHMIQVPLFTVCGLAPSFPLLVITSNSSKSLRGLVAAALPLFWVGKLLKPGPVPLKPLLVPKVIAAEDTGGKLKPIFCGDDIFAKPILCVKFELLKDGDGDVMPSWAVCNKKISNQYIFIIVEPEENFKG